MICWDCKKEVSDTALSYDPVWGYLRTFAEHKAEREEDGKNVYPFYCIECGEFHEGGIFYRLRELVNKMWGYRTHNTYTDREPEYTWGKAAYGFVPENKDNCYVRWFMKFKHGGCVDDGYIETWRQLLKENGFFLKSWRIDFNEYRYPDNTHEFISTIEKLGEDNYTSYEHHKNWEVEMALMESKTLTPEQQEMKNEAMGIILERLKKRMNDGE